MQPRCIFAALAASIVALAGCSGPAHDASDSAAGGCSTSSPATSTLHLAFGGHSRLVVVHAPADPSGRTRALVVNLHGSGSTAVGQLAFSGMDPVADREGFVVAYPQGLIASGSGFDWNVPGVSLLGGGAPPRGAASDVAFLSRLPSLLTSRFCIDPRRVYVTGMSGGGRMASQLGCDAAGVYAAVSPVAGLRRPSPCPGGPEPVIAFHGSADPIDPYGGNGEAYWTYSVPQAAQRWAAHDGCRPTRQAATETGYTVTSYSQCAEGSRVELYTVTGEGHEWPGGPRMPAALTAVLGPQSTAIDADTTMWRFFVAHPLR